MDDASSSTGPRGLGRRKASKTMRSSPLINERRRIIAGSLAATDATRYEDVVAAAANCRLAYMCRAFSQENKEGVHENEDRFFCEEHVNTQKGGGQIDLFTVGVMDGHDGALAADIVAEKMPSSVIHGCFQKKMSVHHAHVAACEEVEEIMKKLDSTAGCCLNSCVMWGRYLWCSNLGDCRAVYIPLNHHDGGSLHFETGKFCWLSRDFRANKPYEITRIRSKGYDTPIVHGRVEGVLEPTRTIGDLDVKANLPDDVISITPETRMIDIANRLVTPRNHTPRNSGSTPREGENLFQGMLLQGTDGVWDGLSGDEILHILNAHVREIRVIQKYMDQSQKENSFDPEQPVIIEKLEHLAQAFVECSTSKPDCTDDTTMILTFISLEDLGSKAS